VCGFLNSGIRTAKQDGFDTISLNILDRHKSVQSINRAIIWLEAYTTLHAHGRFPVRSEW
jgi:hypothetical protein